MALPHLLSNKHIFAYTFQHYPSRALLNLLRWGRQQHWRLISKDCKRPRVFDFYGEELGCISECDVPLDSIREYFINEAQTIVVKAVYFVQRRTSWSSSNAVSWSVVMDKSNWGVLMADKDSGCILCHNHVLTSSFDGCGQQVN